MEKNDFVEKKLISFFGKVMDIQGNIYVILSDNINQIIFLTDTENLLLNSKLNEYKNYIEIKIKDYNDDSLFLETCKTSKKENSVDSEKKIDIINKKILLKYNFIDYKNDENYYNNIGLDISENISIKIKINNPTIYLICPENRISNEYFPQIIKLYSNSEITAFRILVYKGFCNELNIFINIIGGFVYEYYYICMKDNIIPKPKEIKLEKSVFRSNKFWKFETQKRYKITFVNIPNQGTNISNYNSFVEISAYLNSEKIVNYGTFLLEDIEIIEPQKININNSFQTLIKDIESDIYSFLKEKIDMNFLKNKYLKSDVKSKYANEFLYDYRGFYFPDEIECFNYYNNVCIWKILVDIREKFWNFIFQKYFMNLEIIKKKNIDYAEKTILLITLMRRVFHCKLKSLPKIFPKIIFFDEVNEIDLCYKEAYDFHLKLIDSLTEESKLIQPFLQLNSYIMKKVLTEEDKSMIKNAKIEKVNDYSIDDVKKKELIKKFEEEKLITYPAYTISMISVDCIKKHLKSTMKPYALILGKGGVETFSASVYKDNNIICFNEDQIFEEIPQLIFNEIVYRKERKNDFAFILNMHFLHENSSHNKEKIINGIQDSPIIFMDEKLKISIILCDSSCDIGEAGYFTECFIGDRNIILDLVNSENSFGDLLDVKYFNRNNFSDLLQIYCSKMSDKKNIIEEDEKEIESVSSFNKKGKKKQSKKEVKRDAFGFSAEDMLLLEEARRRFCDY